MGDPERPPLPPRPRHNRELSEHFETDRYNLYICRVPGSKDVFLTRHKIKSTVLTHFDVSGGDYLLHYDDIDDYGELLDTYQPESENVGLSIPRKSLAMSFDSSRDRSTSVTATSQSNFDYSELAKHIDAIAMLDAQSKLDAGIGEFRNNSQKPLAARADLHGSAPATLIKLDSEGADHEATFKMLSMSKQASLPNSAEDLAGHEERTALTASSIFLDAITGRYDVYGLDINYIGVGTDKCFTRRLLKDNRAFSGNWFLLSPTQGWLVFESSRFGGAINCYHHLPSVSPEETSERVLVSKLTFNLFRPSSEGDEKFKKRQHRQSVTSSGSSGNERAEETSNISSRPVAYPISDTSRSARHRSDSLKDGLKKIKDTIHSSARETFTKQQSDQAIANAISPKDKSILTKLKDNRHLHALDQKLHSRQTNEHHAFESYADFSLGQEKLGGGVNGEEAKLGKIVVHNAAEEFIDLIIAANIALFDRAYQQVLLRI